MPGSRRFLVQILDYEFRVVYHCTNFAAKAFFSLGNPKNSFSINISEQFNTICLIQTERHLTSYY